ncbi:Mbeg1-like protein [Streptococcus entericus]|uniref:Mbeg1-like protein n=1 Tax=Streptococcus entericus TaxID=155680 RepID=UPI00037C4235|nr:Mbeg1-like protein [Streptococcus entericus]
MANIKDYVLANGHRSFDDLSLNELDIACLNELGYLTFGEHLPETLDHHSYHRLANLLGRLAVAELEQPVYDFLVTPARIELLRAVLTSPRFEDLELGCYVNDVNPDYGRQFAAMVMCLPSLGHTQLIFRGTDDSLIGWKEDFNMSYMRTIPAQQAAFSYLREFLMDFSGKLVVSGHSKGGNLALYASSLVPATLQTKISAVYVFDAPGLHQSVLNSPGYQTIRPRVKAFRPEEAIVGIMLSSDVAYETVISQNRGLLQHDMSHWQVSETAFLRSSQLSQFSLSLEKTFNDWLNQYSNQELKLFFDTFFDLFFTSGIASLNDLSTPDPVRARAMLNTLRHLDKPRREFMIKAVNQLMSLYGKHALADRQRGPAYWGDILGKWQSRSTKSLETADDA